MNNIGFHKLPRVRVVSDRDELILSYCRDKRVLHLGCVGSTEAADAGRSLHSRLLGVARQVIGVDIDADGIDHLKRSGVPDLIRADVQAPDGLTALASRMPVDVVVAGEVLEHLANPGLCLANIADLIDEQDTVLLVSVPNAFSVRSFISVLSRNKELVRGDHNCYFSYVTIRSLLGRHGFVPQRVYTYSNLRAGQNPIKKAFKRLVNATVVRYAPFIAEGLIVVAVKDTCLNRHRSGESICESTACHAQLG